MNFKEGVIIPIDKPYGITSFKALAHVRYLCSKITRRACKIGHAGTLDPLATGVLILATGKMTKQIEKLQTHTKEYVATIQLGRNYTKLRYGARGKRDFSHRTYHERIDRNSIAAIYWRYRTSATHL